MPDTNPLKFFLRPNRDYSGLTLDILCNTFEYEILYKATYPLKEGSSQFTITQSPSENASPASHGFMNGQQLPLNFDMA